jgi:hypothetical protein
VERLVQRAVDHSTCSVPMPAWACVGPSSRRPWMSTTA